MEHHVYFWLKEERRNDPDKKRYEEGLAKLAESACLAEPGRWGRPAATPERPVTDHSWDYAISFRFASMEDHDRYQGPDPHHMEFVEAFKDWWDRVEVKDLEC